MNDRLWEALNQWERCKHVDESEANGHLLVILRNVLEHAADADPTALDRIRLELEYSVEDDVPADWGSYNLGMARTIGLLLQHEVIEKQKKLDLRSLSGLERQIIKALGHVSELTPSQLRERIGIDNRQQVSNLLRALRAKELVHFVEVGKYHWYKLTRDGRKYYEQLKAEEETSTTTFSFPYKRRLHYRSRIPDMMLAETAVCRYEDDSDKKDWDEDESFDDRMLPYFLMTTYANEKDERFGSLKSDYSIEFGISVLEGAGR